MIHKYEIAIIEDDEKLSLVLSDMIESILTNYIKTRRFHTIGDFVSSRCEPDAVLLDLNLPDSMGADTLRRIKEHTSAPVVVLTGRDDAEIIKMRHMGIRVYEKPNTMAAAMTVVEAMKYKHYPVAAG